MHKTIQWFQSMADTKRQHSWSTPLLVLNTNINTILYHHGNHLKCLECVAKPYLLRCLFVVSTKEDGSSEIVPWLLSNQCNIHPPAGLVAILEWFSVSNLKSKQHYPNDIDNKVVSNIWDIGRLLFVGAAVYAEALSSEAILWWRIDCWCACSYISKKIMIHTSSKCYDASNYGKPITSKACMRILGCVVWKEYLYLRKLSPKATRSDLEQQCTGSKATHGIGIASVSSIQY